MMHLKGNHARPQNANSVKQKSIINVTVHTLYHMSGGPCIYGTYAVLPVPEELIDEHITMRNKRDSIDLSRIS